MTYIKSATVIEWKWQNVQGIISDWQSAWRTMDKGSWHCTGDSDQEHLQEKEMKKAK